MGYSDPGITIYTKYNTGYISDLHNNKDKKETARPTGITIYTKYTIQAISVILTTTKTTKKQQNNRS